MKLKLLPLLLCLSVLAACLAGCGSEPAKVEISESPAPTEAPSEVPTEAPTEVPTEAPTEAPTPSETPPETDDPAETPDPEEEARKARYQAAYETYAPDQTVMLVNDEPISWAKYFSWIYDISSQLESVYGVTDWNEPRAELANVVPDSTFGSYVRKSALGYVAQITVIGQKAKELGIDLTEEERSSIQSTIDGYAERVGGQEAFEQLLAESFLPLDYFIEQNEAMKLIDGLYEQFYGADGVQITDADAAAYLKDNGYLYAKHILFRTVDDERNALSEEEIAKKKEEAENVLAQLRDCPAEDLPDLFDSLMQQYSEDTGLLSYPDGYYFRAGEMVPAFEETTRTLEENGLSDLVETDYGYHIIFCPPMSTEHIMGYDSNRSPYKIGAFVSSALFDNMMAEWYNDAEWNTKYVNGFDALDLNELLKAAS